jgi:iron complex transport system permease protein
MTGNCNVYLSMLNAGHGEAAAPQSSRCKRPFSRPVAKSLASGWFAAYSLHGVLSDCEYPISFSELTTVVYARLTGGYHDLPEVIETVLFRSRLPRVIAAVVIGGALAAAGATYQGMFRNPLVSPDILGVAAGAGLGAALGIFLSLPLIGIQLLAFAFGLGTVFFVYVISQAVR